MSRDRGSATVWAALVTTVLGAVFGGVLLLGQAVVARHRAAAAADLASLAAATAWAHGPEAACAAAVRVARAQGATLAECRLGGEVAEVEARVPLGPFTPSSLARAGPPAPVTARAGPSGPVTGDPGGRGGWRSVWGQQGVWRPCRGRRGGSRSVWGRLDGGCGPCEGGGSCGAGGAGGGSCGAGGAGGGPCGASRACGVRAGAGGVGGSPCGPAGRWRSGLAGSSGPVTVRAGPSGAVAVRLGSRLS
ncbi:Rv3654c family TadE-like protein [Streptomyces sp. A1136]|uniref:Rv3654c family TadE-like protein n=1 Tax=Streptomyces sp. A1136 TaxID=2563102 RepID=UPI002795E708|nr:Rv3654c family TadE-like protein [Streptomyces sp. A1136]